MRKADGTEANLKKKSVEMESDLKGGQPLEPKDLVDWTPGEKEITDPMETVGVILKLSEIEDEPEDWFDSKGYDVVRKKDGTTYLIEKNSDRVVSDIVRQCINLLYYGQYAYLKKGDYELYGPVEIKRYQRRLATPLGYITIPIITVDGTPVFFNSKWCLSNGERATYELYNNKTYDYDTMELEKKIMGDLILYSQLGTKTMDESKGLFEKIKKECEAVGTLKKISFDEGIFTLDFDWRMGFDTANIEEPMVFPPFTITIDFIHKNLGLRGWHPHRYNGGFCLGGGLTAIKDECFKNKDIYGLVMGMIQFGGEWNSSDVGHGDRHPGNCIIKTVRESSIPSIYNLPVEPADLILTLMAYQYTYVMDNNWVKEPLIKLLMENEGFRKLFLKRVNVEIRRIVINGILTEEQKNESFIKELM